MERRPTGGNPTATTRVPAETARMFVNRRRLASGSQSDAQLDAKSVMVAARGARIQIRWTVAAVE